MLAPRLHGRPFGGLMLCFFAVAAVAAAATVPTALTGTAPPCAGGTVYASASGGSVGNSGCSPSTPVMSLDAAPPCAGGTVYASASGGSDGNSGCSPSTPVLSLDAAQAVARATAAASPSRSATVALSGVFARTSALNLTEADAGATWAGAPSAPGATLTGGHRVTFAPHPTLHTPQGDAVWWADLAAAGLTPQQLGLPTRHGFTVSAKPPPAELFVDGVRMTRSRFPKASSPPASVTRVRNADKAAPVFDVSANVSARFASWSASLASPGGVWLDGLLGQNWVWTYNRLVVLPNGSATLAFPEVDNVELFSPTYCCHNRFFFDNVFEELSDPGEYYVNTTEMRAYLVAPRPGWSPASSVAELSVLTEPFFRFLPGARNVTVQDLTLRATRGGAVDAAAATGVLLSRLAINGVGGNAVTLGPSSAVDACVIEDVGGCGVDMYGPGDVKTLTPGGSEVTNTVVSKWAYWQKVYTGAVTVGGVGNRVAHCRFTDAPHVGMVVGGNNHVIEFNEIARIALEFVDMGAIYLNLGMHPLQRGTRISSNFFHTLGTTERDLVVGVYPDSSTMGLTVTQNVFAGVGTAVHRDARAVSGNGFSYVNTTNNIFVDCVSPFKLNDWFLESWGAPNYPAYVAAWRKEFANANASGMLPKFFARYPELRAFWSEDRKAPKSNTFSNNLVFNPTAPRAAGNETTHGYDCGSCALSDVASAGVWITDADPGFANASGLNFSLPAARVTPHIPGWVEIDFDAIGPISPVGPSLSRVDGGGLRYRK